MVYTKSAEVKAMKGLFSKLVVTGVIIANVVFTAAVLKVFLTTKLEPHTLITSWFAFTTVEVWSLASIKKNKDKNKDGGSK